MTYVSEKKPRIIWTEPSGSAEKNAVRIVRPKKTPLLSAPRTPTRPHLRLLLLLFADFDVFDPEAEPVERVLFRADGQLQRFAN